MYVFIAKSVIIKARLIVLGGILVMGLCFYYMNGSENFYNKNVLLDIGYSCLLIFSFFIAYVYAGSYQDALNIYLIFSIGMLSSAVVLVFYTIYTAPYLLDNRLAITPISNAIVNTPQFSNIAIYSTIYSVFVLLGGENGSNVKRWFGYVLVSLGVLISIIVQARTYFIILLVLILYVSLRLRKKKEMIGFLLFLFGLIFVGNLHDSSIFLIALDRYVEVGFDTGRYDLFFLGVENIAVNPFGTSSPVFGPYYAKWYHNLWLDIVRTSGVIPLMFFIVFNVYIFMQLKYIYKEWRSFYLWVFLVFNLLFISSVPLEAKQVDYIFFVLFSGLILRLGECKSY